MNNLYRIFGDATLNNIYFIGSLVIIGLIASRRNTRLNIRKNLPLILICLVVLIWSADNIRSGNLYWSTVYSLLTITLLIVSTNSDWVEKAVSKLGRLSLIHVFATVLLFITSPYLYKAIILPFWNGAIPGGLSSINEAYKAGITSHYSTNGLYCSIAAIVFGSTAVVTTRRQFRKTQLLCIIAFFAIILTTKRAHLLFSFAALLLVYYLCSPKDSLRKIFYVFAVIVMMFILFVVIGQFVPVIGVVVDRFIGQEDISNGRFAFWEQAINLYRSNRLVGIGWGKYVSFNKWGTSVHNTYIQLLCETGLIGFTLFIFSMWYSFASAIHMIRKEYFLLEEYERIGLAVSIGVQLFIILYCCTGNCFYDLTAIIYFVSIMISQAISYGFNTKHSEINRNRGY